MEDWWTDKQRSAPDFMRPMELAKLQEWWETEPTQPLVIEGLGGMGKTTLLAAFADWLHHRLPDKRNIDLVDLYVAPLGQRIAQALDRVKGRSLLVLDGAERVPPPEFVDAVEHVRRRLPNASVLVATRRTPTDAWPTFRLNPLTDEDSAALVRRIAGELGLEDAARLGRASEGHPLLATLLAHLASDSSVDAALSRLGEQRFDGLLPSEDLVPGEHLLPGAAAAERELEVRVCAVNDALIKRLADNPDLMYELRPRQLEELMAELYAREGFDVELTQQTRDGGVDLYLVRHTLFGRQLTIVDTKRNRRDRTVGVGVVRELFGVVEAKRASAGVIATTSFFSPDAHRFQQSVPFRLGLQDYFDLQAMLRRAAAKGLAGDDEAGPPTA
jgi:restriction system protein